MKFRISTIHIILEMYAPFTLLIVTDTIWGMDIIKSNGGINNMGSAPKY